MNIQPGNNVSPPDENYPINAAPTEEIPVVSPPPTSGTTYTSSTTRGPSTAWPRRRPNGPWIPLAIAAAIILLLLGLALLLNQNRDQQSSSATPTAAATATPATNATATAAAAAAATNATATAAGAEAAKNATATAVAASAIEATATAAAAVKPAPAATTAPTATTAPAATATPAPSPASSQTVTTYLNALKAGDYAKAYDQLAPDLQKTLTLQAFTAAQQKITTQDGQITTFTITKATVGQDSTGAVTNEILVDITRSIKGTVHTLYTLKQFDGQWKIIQETQQP